MFIVESYEVHDEFGVIRRFSVEDKTLAENFCHCRPDCKVVPVKVSMLELLGEALF